MKESILKVIKAMMKKEMTLKEITNICGGITNKNLYTTLMKLEKMGFLIYEESESKSGCKCRYGVLDVVKGSEAEKLLKGVRK